MPCSAKVPACLHIIENGIILVMCVLITSYYSSRLFIRSYTCMQLGRMDGKHCIPVCKELVAECKNVDPDCGALYNAKLERLPKDFPNRKSAPAVEKNSTIAFNMATTTTNQVIQMAHHMELYGVPPAGPQPNVIWSEKGFALVLLRIFY